MGELFAYQKDFNQVKYDIRYGLPLFITKTFSEKHISIETKQNNLEKIYYKLLR